MDSVDNLIRWLKKSAVIKVLRQHDGLPEDLISNPDSRNYEFFKKIFDTLRLKFIEMEIEDVENTLQHAENYIMRRMSKTITTSK